MPMPQKYLGQGKTSRIIRSRAIRQQFQWVLTSSRTQTPKKKARHPGAAIFNMTVVLARPATCLSRATQRARRYGERRLFGSRLTARSESHRVQDRHQPRHRKPRHQSLGSGLEPSTKPRRPSSHKSHSWCRSTGLCPTQCQDWSDGSGWSQNYSNCSVRRSPRSWHNGWFRRT